MKRTWRWIAGLALLAALTAGQAVVTWAANEWVQDGDNWCYLDANHEKVVNTWKNLDGKYYCFDGNGYMKTGWHFENGNAYYLGDKGDGVMKTGWLCLSYNPDQEPQEGDISFYSSPGDGAAYFYFDEKGKMLKAEDDRFLIKTISGYKYYFDENGLMQTGWVEVKDDAENDDATGISRFRYFGSEGEGALVTGWRKLSEHPSDSTDSEFLTGTREKPISGEEFWYYFDGKGVPKYFRSNATSFSNAVTKIGSEYYFLDEYGCMRTGMIGFDTPDGVNCAYFDINGAMKIGKVQNISDDAGEATTYYFNKTGSNKGLGLSGEADGYLYYNGQLVKASQDYEVFEVDGEVYLVNQNGKVQTGKKFYKVDGEYTYYTNGGKIYHASPDKEQEEEITSGEGELPVNEFEHPYSLDR